MATTAKNWKPVRSNKKGAIKRIFQRVKSAFSPENVANVMFHPYTQAAFTAAYALPMLGGLGSGLARGVRTRRLMGARRVFAARNS